MREVAAGTGPARPAATVIVLSYQPGAWLAPCLESALGQRLAGGVEVLCIDNGSAGRAAAALAAPIGARVLRSETNLGFAGGVNVGLRHARGALVALLNDDAVAGPDWVASAAAALEDPGVAAVGPKVLMAGWWQQVRLGDARTAAPGDHRVLGTRLRSVRAGGREVLEQAAGGGLHAMEGEAGERWRWTVPSAPFYVPVPGPSPEPVEVDGRPVASGPVTRLVNKAGSYLRRDGVLGDFGAETPDDGRFDTSRECFFASGTALVARGATWAAVGPLADEFFAYYEDGDWCWRARLLGMRVLYDAGATVEHRVSATSGGQVSSWVRYLAERNRTLCLLRNAPAAVAAAELRRRALAGPLDGVRRAVLSAAPAALWSRRRMRRQRTVDPRAVWDRWAGVDTTWEGGPPEG
ncbi:glycosyltransferase family 2 protein [Acidiferrimicrobium sp. IK]|uniref:glycosyltransferase family 2 protein n=1 Tax=Acidiferrimicrobium sp. IK TaxID=2871700 RepID=UPI0021CB1757|nr:glycosyltransferase family 2 protein [Acidiferrimicrobium sp. IK]MCU4185556.1 glycosyltransferase family 2 protein [Acidiferrimicrobium sp. IK]